MQKDSKTKTGILKVKPPWVHTFLSMLVENKIIQQLLGLFANMLTCHMLTKVYFCLFYMYSGLYLYRVSSINDQWDISLKTTNMSIRWH